MASLECIETKEDMMFDTLLDALDIVGTTIINHWRKKAAKSILGRTKRQQVYEEPEYDESWDNSNIAGRFLTVGELMSNA